MESLKRVNQRQDLLGEIIKGTYTSNTLVNKEASFKVRIQTPEVERNKKEKSYDRHAKQKIPMKTSYNDKWMP